ncbi:hypothetical protein TrVE_jg6822 [Triparma verrucosa]|uniref:AMP-dependent synthetase/ligase domain-containing protein n=2 Tax=Triparma TaxID=722752 RepID=A0A9W7ARL5_9STRA|nr:hypothetical protein TrST_g4086 [Triparma strigata]GMH87854.1 hypothetical protein TrVE_jg6822 [Triparma verrucosa]
MNTIYCTEPSKELQVRMGTEGAAALPSMTVMDRFDKTCAEFGDQQALHEKQDDGTGSLKWKSWTWNEYRGEVDRFAKSLISIGFEAHDSVNIIGFNAPSWFFANMGAIAAGGVAAGIYTTNLPEACKYVSEHSKAKVVVVEGNKQLSKYLQIAKDLKNLKALVVYGEAPNPAHKCSVPIHSFEDFLKLGDQIPASKLVERKQAQKPGHCCTLIYTSGTTGNPKAVMISHDNLCWTSSVMLSTIDALGPQDCLISYLPLSHIAAQMLDLHCPMVSGSQVYFAQPDALRGSLGLTLKEVKPTVFFGVPRVWEKIYEKMQEVAKVNNKSFVKRNIGAWAKGKAMSKNMKAQFGEGGGAPMTFFIAKKILGKIRAALGLQRCIACYTGAAPIERKVLDYFASIDIPILELFGQSECTGPHTVNTPTAWKIGTCGRPLPGTESKIDPANGEICYRGRHIFMGYMYMADKTKETIDEEGWLHSGDVGKFDEDDDPNVVKPSGFMSITGRIKELIITAGGENIPPVMIENEFKIAMPAVANCMVIGDKRKFLTICLTLSVEMNDDGSPTNKLTGQALETAKSIGSTATTTEEAKSCAKFEQYFNKGMETANGQTTSRAQRVAKWTLLNGDFSESTGELTPTLKLKRSVAATNHSEAIEAMYK